MKTATSFIIIDDNVNYRKWNTRHKKKSRVYYFDPPEVITQMLSKVWITFYCSSSLIIEIYGKQLLLFISVDLDIAGDVDIQSKVVEIQIRSHFCQNGLYSDH